VYIPGAKVDVATAPTPERNIDPPTVVVPAVNVTIPVGVDPSAAATVAVKATGTPKLDGLLELVTTKLVAIKGVCTVRLTVLVAMV
jgi:hypothetical protein